MDRLDEIEREWAECWPCPGSYCNALAVGNKRVPALVRALRKALGGLRCDDAVDGRECGPCFSCEAHASALSELSEEKA